jgi:hypothetical protein
MAGCSRERRRCQQWMDTASERMRKGLGGVGDRPAAAAVRKAWVTRWVRGDTTCGRNRVAREQRNKRAAGRARPQSARWNFQFGRSLHSGIFDFFKYFSN